jgi:hypothetical protein
VLDGVEVRSLDALDEGELLGRELAGLDRCVAVHCDVLTRRDVVVEAVRELDEARALRGVREHERVDDAARRVARHALERGGAAEAEGVEERGPVLS